MTKTDYSNPLERLINDYTNYRECITILRGMVQSSLGCPADCSFYRDIASDFNQIDVKYRLHLRRIIVNQILILLDEDKQLKIGRS